MRGKDFTDILADCLDAIENGERTVAECLALYPEHRDELSALLGTFATVQTGATYTPRPSFKLSSRARLLRRLTLRTVNKPRPSIFKRLIPVGLSLALFVISMLGVGTFFAARDSLLGDSLYPVKLCIEEARLILADVAGFQADRHDPLMAGRLESRGIFSGQPPAFLECELPGANAVDEDGALGLVQRDLAEDHAARSRLPASG